MNQDQLITMTPKEAKKKLWELHEIKLSKETVRQIMINILNS